MYGRDRCPDCGTTEIRLTGAIVDRKAGKYPFHLWLSIILFGGAVLSLVAAVGMASIDPGTFFLYGWFSLVGVPGGIYFLLKYLQRSAVENLSYRCENNHAWEISGACVGCDGGHLVEYPVRIARKTGRQVNMLYGLIGGLSLLALGTFLSLIGLGGLGDPVVGTQAITLLVTGVLLLSWGGGAVGTYFNADRMLQLFCPGCGRKKLAEAVPLVDR